MRDRSGLALSLSLIDRTVTMKPTIISGLCLSIATVNATLAPDAASAQRPFDACLNTVNRLFRDGSESELAAIRACRGTTEPEDVTACIDLVDGLWRNGSNSELAGLEACQVHQRSVLWEDSDIFQPDLSQVGNYATCLREAEATTRNQTARELAVIRTCSGLTQPAEVAPCLSRRKTCGETKLKQNWPPSPPARWHWISEDKTLADEDSCMTFATTTKSGLPCLKGCAKPWIRHRH